MMGTPQEQLDRDLLALKTASMLSLDASESMSFVSTLAGPEDQAVDHEQKKHLAQCIRELPENERRGNNILRGDVVCHVHNRRRGCDGQNDALHAGHIVIRAAEVGCERDDRPWDYPRHQLSSIQRA